MPQSKSYTSNYSKVTEHTRLSQEIELSWETTWTKWDQRGDRSRGRRAFQWENRQKNSSKNEKKVYPVQVVNADENLTNGNQ